MWTALRAWYSAANTLCHKPEDAPRREPWGLAVMTAAGAVGVFYVLTRIFWWLRYGALGFGYDTGIYRHIIAGYWKNSDSTLPPLGFARLSNGLHWLGFSTDAILLGGYVAGSLVLAVAVFVILNQQVNRRAGLIGVFLLTISITQIEFYHWFYFRNLWAAGLGLLVMAFGLRQSWWSGVWLGLIGIIHPVSTIPIGLALFFWLVFGVKNYRLAFKIFSIAALISFGCNWGEWLRYLEPLFLYRGLASAAATTSPEFNGQFITVVTWLHWSWPYLILALPGAWLARKRLTPLWVLAAVAICGIALQVLFFRRLIVWLDLAALVGAAVYLEKMWLKQGRRGLIIFAALVGIFLSGRAIVKYQPAMSSVDWLSLLQLNQLPPNSLVLTVSSQYAPWLYGYTNQRIIAPGMLDENKWNQAQWTTFWFTKNQTERANLLTQYQVPSLYIFLAQSQSAFGVVFSNDIQFKPVYSQVWQFNNSHYPQVIANE